MSKERLEENDTQPSAEDLKFAAEWLQRVRVLTGGNFIEPEKIELGITNRPRALFRAILARKNDPISFIHELAHLLLYEFLLEKAFSRSKPTINRQEFDRRIQIIHRFIKYTESGKAYERELKILFPEYKITVYSFFSDAPELEWYFRSVLHASGPALAAYEEFFADLVTAVVLSDLEVLMKIGTDVHFRNFLLEYSTDEVLKDAKTSITDIPRENPFMDTQIFGVDPHHYFAEVKTELGRNFANDLGNSILLRKLLRAIAEIIDEELIWAASDSDRAAYFRVSDSVVKEANARFIEKIILRNLKSPNRANDR